MSHRTVRRALVLGGGIDQLALVDAFRARGYEVLVVDADANCPGRDRGDIFCKISTIDEDAVLEYARREGVCVAGVISSDRPLRVAARVNAELGHPFPLTYDQAVAVTEKPRMKMTLEAAGVPCARYVTVRNCEDYRRLEGMLRLPLVIKPADSSASRGISFVRAESELPAAVERALAASRSGFCVVEEFAPGQEISVDAVVLDGVPHVLMITDGLVSRRPGRFGLYLANIYPSSISAAARASVRDIIGRVAAHLGVRNSLFFFQMMVEGDLVRVIEYSARNAGAAKSRFIRTVLDYDIVQLYVQLLFDEEPALPKPSRMSSAALIFLYGNHGLVGSWQGFDDLVRAGVIDWYEKFKPVGARCDGLQSGADRLGVYAVTAENAGSLDIKRREVESRVSIMDSEGRDMLVRDFHEEMRAPHA